jgi:plastocyanin
VLKADAAGGSGVFAEINLISGNDVTRLWPVFGGRQLIAGTDQLGYVTDVSRVTVHAGDMIRFEVTANGNNSHDAVSWTPSVAYVSSLRPRIARGGVLRPRNGPARDKENAQR